ncbi:MAG: response regulator [Proteobacteria bacterium]|nr:response regulator [Pseudomonadota bacterium]
MGKHILLVEDTATIIMVEKMMLSGQGYEIATAKNGVEGLKKIKDSPPDLVLLDIMMPEMDGIEMCRRLKNDPETKDIPVIMVTTKGEPDKVEEAFLAGCNDYITKPIDKLELLTKVEKYLS